MIRDPVLIRPKYFHPGLVQAYDVELTRDICVYGGTAAGVVAAVTAVSRGMSVVLLHPGQAIGGMTTNGLGYTDMGNAHAIGGRARQFFRDAGRHYGVPESWTNEPHIAQQVLDDWIEQHNIQVIHHCYINSVEVDKDRIMRLHVLGGLAVKASIFIDTSYEGDLLARAGVSYTIGREDNAAYGETHNGVQVHTTHQFDCRVDPYRTQGVPSSGLLPFVEPGAPDTIGQGDRRIQAYCFRICMTQVTDKQLPFPKPDKYISEWYELAARWLRSTHTNVFEKFDHIQNNKTDTNNHGAVSTDFIGASYDWPEASYEQREAIFQSHVRYQQGLHWFMANDASVPVKIRERYASWGLALDEFEDSGHWPSQLYIREARRMVSDVVVTELHCRSFDMSEEPVGMGAYQMDSHNCRRCIRDGAVINEGDVQVPLQRPYGIPYKSIMPRRGECKNLYVPVCLSASHIAFGSIRMEPVFMVLAESAAIAGCLAIKESCAVQDLPYESLQHELVLADQVLECDIVNEGDGNPHTLVSID